MSFALPIFDAHLHIIDPRFPLVPNQGYVPPAFTSTNYLQRLQPYRLAGGAIVSGSFQAFDQGYLIAALAELGAAFVGVTQLPASTTDQTLIELHDAGVRALRFNVQRGGSEDLRHLEKFAQRVYDMVGWHSELYIDSSALEELSPLLLRLPAVSIDHLGLSQNGFATLLKLVEQGVRVKATGFGRVDFVVQSALQALYAANPAALMFGTDLPSTRAPRAYQDSDYLLVLETLGETAARQVFSTNAQAFYRPRKIV